MNRGHRSRLVSSASFFCAGVCLAASFAGVANAQASPSGYTSGVRYDGLGRVVGTIAPDPDGAGGLHYAAVRNWYDDKGNLVKIEKGELATWQPDTGTNAAPSAWAGFTIFQTVEITYDSLSRKLTELVRGSDSAPISLTQYSYNAIGRLECTAARMNAAAFSSPPAACALGAAGVQGPDRVAKSTYDAAGRLLQVKKGLGVLDVNDVTYTYSANGRQTSVTDANGNKATLAYDGFDRQIGWIFPSKTTPGTSASCNLSGVSEDGNGIAGPTEARGSSDDCEKYAYDRNGSRRKLMKRDGSVIRYTLDALGRITLKDVPAVAGISSTHTRDVYYSFDARGLMTGARFDSVSGEGTTNNYDGFGRLISATLTMDGATRTLSYAYDKDGDRTQLTHPDGLNFWTCYDGLDRADVSWWGGTTTCPGGNSGGTQFFNIDYNERGLRSMSNQASSYTDYSYDPASRLAHLTQRFAGNIGNVTQDFSFNSASQLTSLTTSNNDFVWNASASISLTYARNGLNQYTSINAYNYTYDGNGNLTSDGTTTFAYDAENRLVTASGANNATLRYDPMGRLYEVATTAATTRFLYDGDHLISEYSGSGALLRRYFWGPGADEPILWDEGSAMNCSGTKFLHANHQGSIVAAANCSGNRVAVYTYDEYGIPGGTQGRFGYTGQAWIAEIGMNYYKARMYSPTIGRFMQTDPIGYKDQFNLYAYVGNDPMNKTDPSGLEDVGADCATKPSCTVSLQQTVNIVHQKDGKTVVDSTISVNMNFSKTTDSKGNASWSVNTSVANVSGKAFSNGQLSTMANSIAHMQLAGVRAGFGDKTTQMITAIGVVETRLGTSSAPGAPAFKAADINPMQLSSGRANLNLDHNIKGAMGVIDWAGKPSNYDPTSTYRRYSDGGVNTMANWGGTYNSLAETVTDPP